jgi:hypothetical protein
MCTPLKMGRESVFRPACAVPSLNRRGDLSGLPDCSGGGTSAHTHCFGHLVKERRALPR